MAGGPAVRLAIEERLGLKPGETSQDGTIAYETVPCLGMCEHAPNALNGDRTAGDLTPAVMPMLFLEGALIRSRSQRYMAAVDRWPAGQDRPHQPGRLRSEVRRLIRRCARR